VVFVVANVRSNDVLDSRKLIKVGIDKVIFARMTIKEFVTEDYKG
jgi:hypothetical protein